MRTATGEFKIELWAGPHDGDVLSIPKLEDDVRVPHAVGGVLGGVARYEREGPDMPRRTKPNRYLYAGWENASPELA